MTSAQIAIMATIILYLCLVIFTGVMIGKRSKKSAEGFYLGGRGMGPLVTAMSAEASDMSSYLLMGKFLGIFAPTQLPLAVIEGILTVVVVIALESFAKSELKAIDFEIEEEKE